MDKAYENVKYAVVNFKLDLCCCLAPIRVGVLAIGYFNLLIAMLSLIGAAEGGMQPPLMEAQEQITEEASASIGIMAYSSEVAFNVLLLCGIYRKDIKLLRVYVYFMFATIVASLLVYSMMIAKVSMLTKLVIIGNMVYNVYIILIVRSAIVEIKQNETSEKNGHVTLYSITRVQEVDKIHDIEAPAPTEALSEESTLDADVAKVDDEAKSDGNEKEKLETTNENKKEE